MKFYLVLDYALPRTWPKSTQAEIQNDGGSLGLVMLVLPWFSNIYMIDSKFHFSPTFTSNLFFWTRKKWYMFKTHDIIHPCQM